LDGGRKNYWSRYMETVTFSFKKISFRVFRAFRG
jgi:hypothetical protein